MATKLSFFSIFLSFVCLFHGCFGQQQQPLGQQEQDQCQFQQMDPLEPGVELQAEAGRTQFWNNKDQQFNCAGVAVFIHFIQPRGFLLPSYTNGPLLAYVEKGALCCIYYRYYFLPIHSTNTIKAWWRSGILRACDTWLSRNIPILPISIRQKAKVLGPPSKDWKLPTGRHRGIRRWISSLGIQWGKWRACNLRAARHHKQH